MQPTVSHDKVSTEKLEKEVVKDTAALKTNLTFREGLFPLKKKKKKLDLPPARNLDQLFLARAIIFWGHWELLLLSVWRRLNCSHTVINISQRAITGIQYIVAVNGTTSS